MALFQTPPFTAYRGINVLLLPSMNFRRHLERSFSTASRIISNNSVAGKSTDNCGPELCKSEAFLNRLHVEIDT